MERPVVMLFLPLPAKRGEGLGEGRTRAPHPAPCADLSPLAQGEVHETACTPRASRITSDNALRFEISTGPTHDGHPVPRGAFLMLAPLFLAIGLPVEGVGILIAVDAIPDLFSTVLNVSGDLAAAALVARYSTKAA